MQRWSPWRLPFLRRSPSPERGGGDGEVGSPGGKCACPHGDPTSTGHGEGVRAPSGAYRSSAGWRYPTVTGAAFRQAVAVGRRL